jgi:hypothetical protein
MRFVSGANNHQQSWMFDWEPPKAVLRDIRTIDWILGQLRSLAQTVPVAGRPCRETVDWIVLAHPIEVDDVDIARFANLYPMNARPVQQRDRRFILSSGHR